MFFCKKMRAKRKKLLTNEKFCGIIYTLSENGTQNGSLAQLGEHLPYKQRVSGSSPLTPTMKALLRKCFFSAL